MKTNKYKVTVRCDRELIVEARYELQAEKKGLNALDDPCCSHTDVRRVIKVVDLTGDPVALLGELACRLEQAAFRDGVCRYCGGSTLWGHSENCIIERARYCIEQHREEKHETIER